MASIEEWIDRGLGWAERGYSIYDKFTDKPEPIVKPKPLPTVTAPSTPPAFSLAGLNLEGGQLLGVGLAVVLLVVMLKSGGG